MLDKLEVRLITSNDDFEKVSELIYNTDPFIYPDFAADKTRALSIVRALVQRQIGIFNSENLFLGLLNKDLAGLVIVLNKINKCDIGDVRIIYNDLEVDFTDKQQFLWEHYFEKLALNNTDDEIYISNVCVASEYQNKGIATTMLKYICMKNCKSEKPIALHVLEKNVIGIHLYEKLGFVKKALTVGYSSIPGETNLCYLMVKET